MRPAAASSWPASVAAAAQVFVDDLAAVAVDADDHHHLLRVLRLRPGEVVVACDGTGRFRRCVVAGRGPEDLLRPEGPVVACPRPPWPVTVAFVPVKGDRPDWVVQKLTEAGADRVVVLGSERAVVRWDGERLQHHLQRLRRVARHAAAQSRRPWVPEVVAADDLGQLDRLLGAGGAGGAGSGPLHLAQPGGDPPAAGLGAVAVGPEGGFSPAELAGRPLVGLGPGVLRAETAAVAAGLLLCSLRDGVVDAVR